ncbi:MAG: pirin family protein [Polyangiaceae bacterium]
MHSPVLERMPLGSPPWPTLDPFLFCVHHKDAYPKANAELGPAAALSGRQLGQDFGGKDGWNMYHGLVVPGFPAHPHRGFETVTIVRRGLVDHSDSLGATARYGAGDVQWLTAGAGIQHAEMFPLTKQEAANPLELFQLWLNLPASGKMSPPHFSMFWQPRVPRVRGGTDGANWEVAVIAGRFADAVPPSPPPDSWASRAEADVAIWTLRASRGARLTLPKAKGENTLRALYFFDGDTLRVGDETLRGRAVAVVRCDEELELGATDSDVDVLVLQGRPIGEPVAQHGPFVMNSRAELQQAFVDYQRTKFGGWPWDSEAPHHGPSRGRFAKHADGRVEEAPPAPEQGA